MATKRKARAACATCRKGLRRSWTTCPRCGRPVMARDRLTKSAAAALARAGRPRCSRCGGASPAGSRCCTHCGTALLTAVKGAGDGRREALLAKIHAEPNNLYREAWWRQLAAMDRLDGSAS